MQASCKRAAPLVQRQGVVPYATSIVMEVVDSDPAVTDTSNVAQPQGSIFTMTVSSPLDTPATSPSLLPASPLLPVSPALLLASPTLPPALLVTSSAARPLPPPQTEDVVSPTANKIALTDNFAGPSTVRHSCADQL